VQNRLWRLRISTRGSADPRTPSFCTRLPRDHLCRHQRRCHRLMALGILFTLHFRG